jgi:hypothetical protein
MLGMISALRPEYINKLIRNDGFEIIKTMKNINFLAFWNSKNSEKILFGLSPYYFFRFNDEYKISKSANAEGISICTLNRDDCIFGFIPILGSIYKYNGSFKEIKSIPYLTNHQVGMSCNNKFLYVANNNEKKIKKYDFYLNFIEDLQLDFFPFKIQSSEKLICITRSDPIISFYDLSTKKIIFNYNNNKLQLTDLRVNHMRSKFYVTSAKDKLIFCINDDNPSKMEEIKIGNRLEEFIKSEKDGDLIINDSTALCISNSKNCVLKFKFVASE